MMLGRLAFPFGKGHFQGRLLLNFQGINFMSSKNAHKKHRRNSQLRGSHLTKVGVMKSLVSLRRNGWLWMWTSWSGQPYDAQNGCWTKNRGWKNPLKSSHVWIGFFHYKISILGAHPYFWKYPNTIKYHQIPMKLYACPFWFESLKKSDFRSICRSTLLFLFITDFGWVQFIRKNGIPSGKLT